jgi:WD40 repeat protein
VRTISFNYDGQYIASASEDLFIDIVSLSSFKITAQTEMTARMCFNGISNFMWVIQSEVETGRSVYQIPCRAAMNSVEWNPKYNLLAFAADDKNKYQADEGKRTGISWNLSLMHYVLKIIREGNVVCSFCTMYNVLIWTMMQSQ